VSEAEEFLGETAGLIQFLHLLHLPLIPTVIFSPTRLIELGDWIKEQTIKEEYVVGTIFAVSDGNRLQTGHETRSKTMRRSSPIVLAVLIVRTVSSETLSSRVKVLQKASAKVWQS